MSFKKNVIANYTSQLYILIVGIALIPVYTDLLGIEAYGLVGFYVTLQAWYMLLDFGLSPTVSREVAVYEGGALSATDLCILVRSIEIFFVTIAVVGVSAFIYQSTLVSQVWLKSVTISTSEISLILKLMALVMASRWLSGIYRAIITGFEKMIWLSGASALIATLRFVLVIPVLMAFEATPRVFFCHQLIVALMELLIYATQAYRLMPSQILSFKVPLDFSQIKRIYKFGLTIAFTSMVWVVTTQFDKLIISGMIPLKEFGQFVLATSLAGGIIFCLTPVSSALMPRLSLLSSKGYFNELLATYRNATQITAIVLAPIVSIMCFHSEAILWIWTGNSEIASSVSTVLLLYSLGNGLLVFSAFPYFLQYARGDLKLHLYWNIFFLLAYSPILIMAINCCGTIGAAWTWVLANCIGLFAWVPFAHRRLLPGFHQKWVLVDIMPILITVFLVGWLSKQFLSSSDSRFFLFIAITLILTISYLAAAVSSSYFRSAFKLQIPNE